MDTDNKKSILFHKPLQLYPSPWKPESHTHNPSWQNEFGPQGGEHIGVTAKIVCSLLVGKIDFSKDILLPVLATIWLHTYTASAVSFKPS